MRKISINAKAVIRHDRNVPPWGWSWWSSS